MYKYIKQKVKIKLEDIIPFKLMPFDVYDQEGNKLCNKGDNNSAKLIALLSNKDLYRQAYPEEVKKSSTTATKISKETASKLIRITKRFLDHTERGNPLSKEDLYATRDIIVNEVVKNIKEIHRMEQMRVYYDEYYVSHTVNVSIISTILAARLGYKIDFLKELTLSSLLHDIGMTRMPKEIVNKPSKLTDDEFNIIKHHPRLGYKIIIDEYLMDEKLAVIALEHHERYNGSGYPKGIAGDEIDYFAQIVSVADVYDASASNKVYAASKDSESIIRELLRLKGSFNPAILNTLIYMIENDL